MDVAPAEDRDLPPDVLKRLKSVPPISIYRLLAIAPGANTAPALAIRSMERLFVHLATLADGSGEPRSITGRRLQDARSVPAF